MIDFDQLKATTCLTCPIKHARMEASVNMSQPSITGFLKRKAGDSSDSVEAPKQPKRDENNNDELKQPTKPKKKSTGARVKKFQNAWFKEFEWLRKDPDNESPSPMYCSSCESASGARRSLKSNAFVLGTFNFQRSALVRHMDSDDHLLAKKTLTQRRYMAAAKKCATKSVMPILDAQIRTAAFLAEQNLPNRKFLKLIDLQLANGASVFLDKKGIYTNHQAPASMQKYVANVLKDTALVRIRDSPYLGIMVDESLDIATNKKLVMFCRIVHGGVVRVELCANISIVDGKAETVYDSILNWLQENGISITKVSGFGSDGASVMTGRLNGVGVKLKSLNPRIIHIWCAAHRLALVSYWAAKRVPYFNNNNNNNNNVFIYRGNTQLAYNTNLP